MHSTENYQHNDVNDTSTDTNYPAEFRWLSNRKVRRYADKHHVSISEAFKRLYK